jgi:hypothetical protein
LFRGEEAHGGGVLQYEFVGCFSSVDEVGIDEFGGVEVVEEYVAGFDVSVAAAVPRQKLQHPHHRVEDAHYFLLRYGFLACAVAFNDFLQGAGEVVVLEVEFALGLQSAGEGGGGGLGFEEVVADGEEVGVGEGAAAVGELEQFGEPALLGDYLLVGGGGGGAEVDQAAVAGVGEGAVDGSAFGFGCASPHI